MNIAIESIQHNKKVHDIVASIYDKRHVEIFNPTEQQRISRSLLAASLEIKTNSHPPYILDFGAGTGNLTKHLTDLGTNVVAADLSSGLLEQLKLKLGRPNQIKTLLLNGEDLSNIEDNSFDMVTTYSVLHHIPDYLKIIDEFVRVVKTGGIIYIDHEVCPSYWEEKALYQSYLCELGYQFSQAHLKELGLVENLMTETEDFTKNVSRLMCKGTKIFSLRAWKTLISNLLSSKDLPVDLKDVKIQGRVRLVPARDEFSYKVNDQYIVELYSK